MLAVPESEGESAEKAVKPLDSNDEEDTLTPVQITPSETSKSVRSPLTGEDTALDGDKGGTSTTTEAHDLSSTVKPSVGILGPVKMRKVQRIITTGDTTIEFIEDDSPAKRPYMRPDTDSESSADLSPKETVKPRAYVIEPNYVLELRDYTGDIVKREESTKPYKRDKPYKTSNVHVLEIVWTIKSDLKPYASAMTREMIFATLPFSNPILHILSPLLLRAMHDILTYYPDQNVYSPMKLPYPFSLLVHHTKELEAYKSTNNSALSPKDVEERNRHIDCALELVNVWHEEAITGGKAGLEQNPPVTTFKNYWMLLKPGALVYKTQHGVISTYVVHDVTGGVENERLEPYQITLWNLNFNGRRLGRCSEVEFLTPFEGERPITSLSVYPVDFHQGGPTMREQMIDRGRKYMSLTRPTYCNYDGHTLSSPVRPYNGRVMVDTAMLPWHESDNPGFFPVLVGDPSTQTNQRPMPRYPFDDDNPTNKSAINSVSCYSNYDYLKGDSNLTEKQLLLCSYYVFGYLMKTRKWEVLDVDKIFFREYDADLMDKLVISDENKHMIKAICRDYTQGKSAKAPKEWSADFIEGKGEGQIFLLHGRPGVGKTLTAECVAEFTQRPLLAITPGDIGTEPKTVERELNKFFRLGEQWGAILLLDEADVYLESRSVNDLTRNSLVSVFLRALEYYQGILFLTTNRVGSFDEAFASRIHVSIHYGDLGEDGRQVIWENLFKDLESDRPEAFIEYTARAYVTEDGALRSLDWNGRQIRNAFRTAVSLAEYEAAEVKPIKTPCKFCKAEDHAHENCGVQHPERKGKTIFIKHQHLKSVTEMSSRFKEYLKSTKNADESKLAKLRNMRDDDYRDK